LHIMILPLFSLCKNTITALIHLFEIRPIVVLLLI
jgi:hypothetical protein